MKYSLFIILIFLSSMVNALNIPDDFWDECPGPACPSNEPFDSETEIRHEGIERSLEREERIRDNASREIERLQREMGEREIIQYRERAF